MPCCASAGAGALAGVHQLRDIPSRASSACASHAARAGGRALVVAPLAASGDSREAPGPGTSYHQAVGPFLAARPSPRPRIAHTRDAASSRRAPSSLFATAKQQALLPGDDTKFTLDDLVNLIVKGIHWQRITAWAFVLTIGYLSRDFMGMGAVTFMLAYLGNSVISLCSQYMPKRRRMITALWFSAIILGVACFGLMTIPVVTREGVDLVMRIQSENPYVQVGEKIRNVLGDAMAIKLERFLSLLSLSSASTGSPTEAILGFAKSVDPGAADVAVWTAENASQLGRALQSALKQHTTTAVVAISTVLSATTRFTVQGVVSLVLSFVIVWDLPLITRGIDSLKSSRLGFIYNEVAPPMAAFGALFGKALQAQASVAVVNTVLTSLGMVVLQIPGVGFLSLIVFFCSFIPVAGVVLSTVPIGFVALTEYGIARFFACIGMVLIAHAVEAYLLNPAIYSAHLKLHPLIVLVVLVMAEHLLGVWGLLLAVPLSVFVIEFMIKRPDDRGQLARDSLPPSPVASSG